MGPLPMKAGLALLLIAGALPLLAEAPVQMPAFLVDSPRVALQEPAGTFAMPVTALRFEPLVDVEARNLAEAQADVTIRGGIFENTGFRLGASDLFDPQTGHYFAEIPVPPDMLSTPRIETGPEQALDGFNANVGSIAYAWQRIQPRGALTAAAGQYGTAEGSLYAGGTEAAGADGFVLGADASAARSISRGSVPFGDHRFTRVAARLQLAGPKSQTDLFAGYQEKFFGWPNLYTPFNSDETENLHTTLVALNHRVQWGDGDWLEAGLFWRRNRDDYAFNRFAPVGPVPPFFHTTWVEGAAVSGRSSLDGWALGYDAEAVADDLRSTALTFGRFHSRTYVKLGVVPEKTWSLEGERRLTVRTGATCDDTNRDGAAFSPIAEIALAEGVSNRQRRFSLSYAQTTQVPTYTALDSNPTAGLFRGNPGLGRSTSRSFEFGADEARPGWQAHAAVFYRRDTQLVDWTYQQGVLARTANPVDLGTTGAEAVVRWSGARGDLVLGYTVLHKQADYGSPITASFYALNYPRQRLTAAVVLRLGHGIELRMDNQARIQAPNALRTIGGDRAVISSLALSYRPRLVAGLELSVQADNLWDSSFQEVPAVPAARREISARTVYRW